LTLTPTPRVEPLIETRFDERGGVVSPDGRWLAYESNRAGLSEIYVRPFPAVGDGLWKISSAGGVQPLWAPRGQELFYVAPDGTIMGVSVEPAVPVGPAARWLGCLRDATSGAGNVIRHYDVTADGQRSLMIKEDPANAAASVHFILVLNWFEELKRLVPTK
jgi:eukaryotic-like serine/threonine-protein kinase